jgi:hypothetical protein
MTRLAIGRISEDLMSHEALRADFARNPSAFLKQRYGLSPTTVEGAYFNDLASKVADGLCCGGCVCA